MPKSCSYCDFYNMRLVRCTRIPKWLEIDVCNYRDKGCPLVEVPAPHGDLIDIDSKIIIGIKDGLKVTTVRDLLNDKAVRLPKTVIEAEVVE